MKMSPQKRMKKRKELDALLGGGGGGGRRSRPSSTSGHRLLRSEQHASEASESGSDEQSFRDSGGGAAAAGRRCLSLCTPLCVCLLVMACVFCGTGLVWMHITLRQELESTKGRMQIMETAQKLWSQELQKLSEELKNQQMKIQEMKNGERETMAKLNQTHSRLGALDSSISRLKGNIRSAADLMALPHTLEELQKSVASIGSSVTSLQHDISQIPAAPQDQNSRALPQTEENPLSSSSRESLKQEVQSWCSNQIQSLRRALSIPENSTTEPDRD
ncbi:hypothetical protein DNTS_004871 [Danionella cerebrum]|uniref:EF-hand calcium-binding domain-containing protein 14 n=1 Tax=Danionella cerebrum TaxID=2873325 RepID=A0A553NGR4_9TELE|nr:hypothetical protein DNTS_004871 [Danionella translucida]